MADIFREVDEDLRHERYLKLWRRWRYWLLGVGVAALGGAVAYVMLADAQESAREAEGPAVRGRGRRHRGRPQRRGRGSAG